jgi:hypothetical protein
MKHKILWPVPAATYLGEVIAWQLQQLARRVGRLLSSAQRSAGAWPGAQSYLLNLNLNWKSCEQNVTSGEIIAWQLQQHAHSSTPLVGIHRPLLCPQPERCLHGGQECNNTHHLLGWINLSEDRDIRASGVLL